MKNIIVMTILLLALFLSSCQEKTDWSGEVSRINGVDLIKNKEKGLWEDDPAKEIHFEKELTIGSDKENELNFMYIGEVKVDRNGTIYVLDVGDKKISKINPAGELIWQIGTVGQGPGEFQNMTSMALDALGNVYVYDSQNKRITTLNADGVYQHSISMKLWARSLDLINNETFLLTEVKMGFTGAIGHLYDLEGNFISTLPESYEMKSPDIPAGTNVSLGERFQVLNDGNIYLATPHPYEIWQFNTTGTLRRKIIKEDKRLVPPKIERFGEKGISIFDYGQAGFCYYSPKGYLVNNCSWPASDENLLKKQRNLDFFDTDGRYLKSVVVNPNEKLTAIDPDNRFYFLQNEPFPAIIRRSVAIK